MCKYFLHVTVQISKGSAGVISRRFLVYRRKDGISRAIPGQNVTKPDAVRQRTRTGDACVAASKWTIVAMVESRGLARHMLTHAQ